MNRSPNPPRKVPELRIRCRVLVAVAAMLVLGGCAGTFQRPPPLALDEIVRLAKAGTPSTEIIQRLRDTRTVHALSGSQFAKLREQGVPDDVLDHLQNAYVGSVETDTRFRYQGMYGGWGYPYPFRPFRGGLHPYWYY
jgi:hypothetical protein